MFSQGALQLFKSVQRVQSHLDQNQRSLLAKTDQLLESEEEIVFLKATTEELVDHSAQLSA